MTTKIKTHKLNCSWCGNDFLGTANQLRRSNAEQKVYCCHRCVRNAWDACMEKSNKIASVIDKRYRDN